MKRHIVSLAAAGSIVAIAIVLPMLWAMRRDTLGVIAGAATWPIYPAFYLMMFTGPHRGPDGMASYLDACVLAFVLWWLAIDFGPRLFRQGDAPDTQRKTSAR